MTSPDKSDDDQLTEAPSVEIDHRRIDWTRVLAYGIVPGLALLLTFVAGFSKWHESSSRTVQIARTDSLAAARESAVAILSYQADSVEKTLVAARNRLTSPYKDDYVKLTTDVVIPGA